MNKEQINHAYIDAKSQYATLGVDVDTVIKKLDKFSITIHCWQADDVTGFENSAAELTGGIQVSGNYPGKARTYFKLRSKYI